MSVGNIFTAKELSESYQPLLLCEFTFKSGRVLRVSTHPLSVLYGGSPTVGSYEYGGNPWYPRVMNQDIGATQAMSDLGVEVVPQVTVILADPDKTLYLAWEAEEGFKGATLRMYGVMWDIGDTSTGSFSSNSPAPIKFIGTCSSPSFDDRTMSIAAVSLLNMSQIQMPPVRVQPRCSWSFPTNAADRAAGLVDPSSIFWECGYSYGLMGGVGNPQTGTAAFTSCTYDFDACNARLGDTTKLIPIIQDRNNVRTGRFGGYRFIPNQSGGLQRPFLTGKWEELVNASNEARYGDFVPMCYGTTWVEPLVMGVWGDGNYSNFEVLVGYGKMTRIKKVVVNGEEVQKLTGSGSLASDAETNTFKNGWWGSINDGDRNGYPSTNAGWGGKGDPYGSTCAIYISVLRTVAQESEIPKVQVLLEGVQIRQYSDPSTFTTAYSSNPAWILLDLLVWSTWRYEDIDLQSFIDSAAKCDEQIYFNRMDGTYSNVYFESSSPVYRRYSCGFSIRQRTSIGELIRGVRNCMKAMLFFDYISGKLKLVIKETLASQQPSTITGSNYDDDISSVTVAGVSGVGHAAYRFNQTNIKKSDDGRSSLQIYQKANQDAANKVTITFQNRENSYSQDTATIVDTEDVSRLGQEVYGSFPLQGAQTFDQVRRISNTWFAETYRGNARLDYQGSDIGDTGGTLYFELETSVKAIHLMVGQICLLTDQQHGITNQPVRLVKIQPTTNFETAKLTLTFHNDNWYQDSFGQVNQPKYSRRRPIIDRKPFAWRPDIEQPMSGDAYYDTTEMSFGLKQEYETAADGTIIAKISITGKIPVNSFPDEPGRPTLELVGVGATGGSYPTDKTYYVGLAAKSSNTAATPISALSKPLAIMLSNPDDALSFTVQHWPDTPSGYFAFAGENPFSMTYQSEGTSSPSTIVLTNAFKQASWGAPDEAFTNFRWRIRRVRHSGVFGAEVASVGTSSITLGVLPNWGFTTDEWAGRVLSVIGIEPISVSATLSVPIANFLISGNSADTLYFSAGNPTTCVGGDSLSTGDVVVMRFDLTFGEDALGKYFEDAKNVNRLNVLLEPYTVTDATNASPIVLTIVVDIGSPFPFDNGDTVVVQGVLGNTSAIGGWIVANRDTVAKTFELQGSTGNGAYSGGGIVNEQFQGLEPEAERGKIAFITVGTGRGTQAKIKDNTSTRVYIDGDWPVQPDSTSQVIILEPVIQVDLASDRINNQTPEASSVYEIDVRNYRRQTLFINPATESANHNLSPSPLDPFREIFLFGNPGSAVAGFNGAIYLQIPGTLAIGSDQAPIVFVNKDIQPVAIKARVKQAPVGADLVINLRIGASALMTLTIPDGTDLADATDAEIAATPTIPADTNVIIDLNAVGTTFGGGDLTVIIYF